MIKANLFRSNTYEIGRFLIIASHPMAKHLVEPEIKELLMNDPVERVTLYKAPIYLACSVHEGMEEKSRARVLLNKVANFEKAHPTDLNCIINRAF